MSDVLGIVLLIGVWLLNFGISTFNAIGVGMTYRQEPKGWMKLVLWSVITMSVAGFTWCYLILLALVAGATGYLAPEYVTGALDIGYILIIFPVLGAGLVMWIQSVATAYKERSVWNIAVAGWNTFAMIANAWSAFRYLPASIKNVGDLFKGGNSKEKGILIMIAVVIMAILGGIITTYCLIKYGEKVGTSYGTTHARKAVGY